MHSLLLLLALQTVINNPAKLLYDRIFNEQRPAQRLQLIAEFESKYASASSTRLALPEMKAQVFGFATEIYEQQKNGPKIIEYGEKTLRYDAENLHSLVLLARQYAVTGDKADLGVAYAKRAITVVQKLQKGPVRQGFTKESWERYLETNRSSAQSTLDYIRTVSQHLALTGRKP